MANGNGGRRVLGAWGSMAAGLLLAACGGGLERPSEVVGLGPDGERIDRTALIDLDGAVDDVVRISLEVGPDALVTEGFELHREGRFTESAARFLLAADRRPLAKSFAAWALLEESALERSYELSVDAVRALPDMAVTHFVLALAASANGRDDEAAEAYERVLELEPAHVGALNNLGSIAYRAERLTEARAFMERAFVAATMPEDIALLQANLAELDALDGDLRAAESGLVLALETSPREAFVHLALGALYDVTGRDDEAAAAMRTGVALDPFGSTRRSISFVWPELRLHFDALRAEAFDDFAEARRLWTQLEALESTQGLNWSPLAGRATAHLARLRAFDDAMLASR